MPSIFGESSLLDDYIKSLKKSAESDGSNANSLVETESPDNVETNEQEFVSTISDVNDKTVVNISKECEYVKTLQDEVDRLKCLLKTTSYMFASQPIADITYFDNDLSRKFKASAEKFINTKFTEDLNVESREDGEKKEHQPLSRCIYFKDYVINSYGQFSSSESLSSNWEIPGYEPDIERTLGNEDRERADESSIKKKARISCFNCGGDHSISNCPDAKDQVRINANKNNFLSNTPTNSNSASKRYHRDDMKYQGLKPGLLSNKLREALGLKENELPPYIYQMRVLGYPPGHLQHARTSRSQMAIFGSNGEEMLLGNDQLEDGELSSEEAEQAYDREKIIHYPGFNVQVPENFVDDHLRNRMPAMQPYHNIDFMMQHLNKRVPNEERITNKREADRESGLSNSAKKRKLNDDENTHVVDMDIDDDSDDHKDLSPHPPPVPYIHPPPPPPPIPDSPQSPPPPPLPDSSVHHPSNNDDFHVGSLVTKCLPSSSAVVSSTADLSTPETSLVSSGSSQTPIPYCPESPSSPAPANTLCCMQSVINIPISPKRMVESQVEEIVKRCDDSVDSSSNADTTITNDTNYFIVIDDDDDEHDYIINIDDDEIGTTPDDCEVSTEPIKTEKLDGENGNECSGSTDQPTIINEKHDPSADKDSTLLLVDSVEHDNLSSNSSEAPSPPLVFCLGTPLVSLTSSFQVFESLPPLEKFSEGVVNLDMPVETTSVVGGFKRIQMALSKRKKK